MIDMEKVKIPKPEKIVAARVAAGITQGEAATLCGLGARTRWTEYENGTRTPKAATWVMFLLLTDQHEDFRLARRRS